MLFLLILLSTTSAKVTTLTKDELLTYFDNIESNLSRVFLEVSNWQALSDKSLIKEIDDVLLLGRCTQGKLKLG